MKNSGFQCLGLSFQSFHTHHGHSFLSMTKLLGDWIKTLHWSPRQNLSLRCNEIDLGRDIGRAPKAWERKPKLSVALSCSTLLCMLQTLPCLQSEQKLCNMLWIIYAHKPRKISKHCSLSAKVHRKGLPVFSLVQLQILWLFKDFLFWCKWNWLELTNRLYVVQGNKDHPLQKQAKDTLPGCQAKGWNAVVLH